MAAGGPGRLAVHCWRQQKKEKKKKKERKKKERKRKERKAMKRKQMPDPGSDGDGGGAVCRHIHGPLDAAAVSPAAICGFHAKDKPVGRS